VTNVSVAPYTYTEDFLGDHAVLSRDNLKISFAVHTVWRVGDARLPLFMVGFSTTVTNGNTEKSPDAIVKVAFGHFVREPLRTFARDEVQRRNGLPVKDELIAIGEAVPSASVSTPTQAPSSSAASLWETSNTPRGSPTQYPESWPRRRSSNEKHVDRDRTEGEDEARRAGRGHRDCHADQSAGSSTRSTFSTKRSRRRS
jgi:hypothetical protein